MEKALASFLKNFGEDAPSVANCRSNLAGILRDLGGRDNLDRAVEELGKALESSRKNFGENGPQTVFPRVQLASVLFYLAGKVNLFVAQTLLSKALSIAILHYGESHSITLNVLNGLDAVENRLNNE
jgi:hypothetical protein